MQGHQLVILPPAIESLLATSTENSLWPAEIQNSPEIQAQSEIRIDLFAKLGKLFQQIPNATTNITEAVDSQKVEPEILAEIYELLANFIEADSYNKRLILYLPFELIPNKTWQSASIKLSAATTRFMTVYMKHWHELLRVVDVRTNFFDGNILEPELSPNGQSMVCKAAHFIPFLVKKGYLSIKAVLDLMEKTENEVLRISISETLPILHDISTENRKITIRIPNNETGPDWLQNLGTDSEFELRKIEMRRAIDLSREMPKLRIAWERQERENALIDKYSDIISAALVGGLIHTEDTRKFLASTTDKIPRLAVINGVRKAVESIAKGNLKKAQDIFLVHQDNIKNLWLQNIPEVKDALISLLSRLAHLNVINGVYLEQFGIKLPQLDALVCGGEKIIETEFGDLKTAVESITLDSEVLRLIYPVAIFFGSRLKGYAKVNADLDCGVFVRAGVPIEKRPKIQQALSKIFSNDRIDGKIVEFWLAEEGGKLQIRNFPNPDVSLADGTWIHLLFGSVWIGEEEMIKNLYQDFLSEFIYSKDKKIDNEEARSIWLGELERDVLQYRLMHKGYRRLYPEQGGINSEHAEALDPQSSFWDSGYRRVATKLFISKVFLPQLEVK